MELRWMAGINVALGDAYDTNGTYGIQAEELQDEKGTPVVVG